MKTRSPVLFLVVFVIGLAGCSWQLRCQLATPPPTSSPFEKIPSPTATSVLPFYLEPSYVVTRFGDFAFPDAQFRLRIEEQEPRCHSLSEPVRLRLKFAFYALSIGPVRIFPDLFQVSTNRYFWNDVIVIFWPAEEEVYPVMSFSYLDAPPKPAGYYRIPAWSGLDKEIEYELPKEIEVREIGGNQRKYLFPVRPGQYYLKVEYWLMRYDDQGKLEDVIGKAVSNRITICVQ